MANYLCKKFSPMTLVVSHNTSVADKWMDRWWTTTHANSSIFTKVWLAKHRLCIRTC